MKWIRLVLWKTKIGHDSIHRRTDGHGETSLPAATSLSRGYSVFLLFLSIITFYGSVTAAADVSLDVLYSWYKRLIDYLFSHDDGLL